MKDAISVASIRASLDKRDQKNFAPWSKIPPEVWAEEIYRLPNGLRFRWDYAPYSRQMFRSIFDRHTVETIFEMYSRGLKSTVILLAIGYIIDQAPRRILSLWPTNSQAEKWSKDNLCRELLDSTPLLNYLGSQTGRRIASNTLLHKLFPGGLIDIFGANAPGDMRRSKGSFLYADEIDAIETTLTDEGDQLAIFSKRGDEYPDTIRVSASYPSIKGHSRINAKLSDSDGNEWFSTCVRCGGEPYVMHRLQMRFEKEHPELARIECPKCKELLTDSERYEMAHRQGFDNWKPARPFRGKRGFHANALLWPHPVDKEKYPAGLLQMLAQQEIDAENSDNPKRSKRVLVNTVDAEPFDPTDESEKPPDWRVIFDRREDYGLTVPEGGLFLTAFVDVQLNRLEVGWDAWGHREENWSMDHVVLDGAVRHPDVWRALAFELSRTWDHASGAEMKLGFALIDGGHYADDVYRFFVHLSAFFQAGHPFHAVAKQFFKGVGHDALLGMRGHVRASKGIGQHGHPVVNRDMMTVAKNLKGHHLGTWEAKDRIYERLRMDPNSDEVRQGVMHFNRHFTEEFFQQLVVETVSISYDGGQEIRKYENLKSLRNEALDIKVGTLAAWRLREPVSNLAAIERALAAQLSEKDAPPPPPQIKARRRSSFVSSWR